MFAPLRCVSQHFRRRPDWTNEFSFIYGRESQLKFKNYFHIHTNISHFTFYFAVSVSEIHLIIWSAVSILKNAVLPTFFSSIDSFIVLVSAVILNIEFLLFHCFHRCFHFDRNIRFCYPAILPKYIWYLVYVGSFWIGSRE